MMKSEAGIVWLASYPRSGNTWLGIFLMHLLSTGGETVDINQLRRKLGDMAIASNRASFDALAGVESSDLAPDEVDRLRPRVYEAVAAASERPSYIKVHDAYLLTPDNEPLMPAGATRAAVCIVRNPLDVAVSNAFFAGHQDFDLAIAQMANPERTLSFKAGKLSDQLRQRLSTWSGHVTSWLDAPGIKCHLVRYEDMVQNPCPTFTALVKFLGLPQDTPAISNAIERASFHHLREAEERHGFVEKLPEALHFFRAGRVGDWRDHLSPAQAARIVGNHRTVMERLGYLNPDGSPKF